MARKSRTTWQLCCRIWLPSKPLLSPTPTHQNIRWFQPAREMKYLTRFAGFEDKHVLWFEELAIEDTDQALDQIQKKMNESSVKVVLCGSTPSENLKEVCARNDCRLIQIDLLESKPVSGDFLSGLKANLKKLSELNTASN